MKSLKIDNFNSNMEIKLYLNDYSYSYLKMQLSKSCLKYPNGK
jgi:hypothetical protein